MGELDKLEAFAAGRQARSAPRRSPAVSAAGSRSPLYRLADAFGARRHASGAGDAWRTALEDGEAPLLRAGHAALRGAAGARRQRAAERRASQDEIAEPPGAAAVQGAGR